MRWGWLGAVAACLVVATGAGAAPLEVYGRLPTIENLALSPDGTELAYVANVGDKRIIRVETVEGHHPLGQIAAGSDKLRALEWADNENLLIESTNAYYIPWRGSEAELGITLNYNVPSNTVFNVMDKVHGTSHLSGGLPQPRRVGGKTMLFVPGGTRSGLYGVLTVFAIDPVTGEVLQTETGTKNTGGFLVGDDGKVSARIDYDDDTKRWSLMTRQGNDWREAYGVTAGIDMPSLIGLGTAADTVLIRTIENDAEVYREFNTGTGAVTPLALPAGANGVIHDPLKHTLIGTIAVDDRYRYTFFDPHDQATWNSVADAFPGEGVQLVSWSEDRKHIVILVDGPRDGSAYEIVDLNAHRADLLGPAYADIGPADVAEVRSISYAAADGLAIPAFLTLPNGKDPKNLPLVVFPHGGPAARDEPGFDWWAQAMASRGYAVLQPEFRGSTGYGWPFFTAGFGQWGRKMQTDLSDGVRYLASQGIVDPQRVCIVGASYGGYAALAGATLEHGVYRCAVSVAGVSDPMYMMGRIPGEGSGERYLERFFGVTGFNDSRLNEIAPLAHSGQADIPILLLHGTRDSVVPHVQSKLMYDALMRDGKQVTFISLDSEDHWLSSTKTRQRMLEETVKFLEANNPPG
jgi:dipeptidyl aminopeptidase/acylaminoacyl peptidase